MHHRSNVGGGLRVHFAYHIFKQAASLFVINICMSVPPILKDFAKRLTFDVFSHCCHRLFVFHKSKNRHTYRRKIAYQHH